MERYRMRNSAGMGDPQCKLHEPKMKEDHAVETSIKSESWITKRDDCRHRRTSRIFLLLKNVLKMNAYFVSSCLG
jgi:hypothetical protein